MKLYFDENEPIFSTSDMAEKLNIHQRTLRIYDNEGILTPKRTQKNRRKYSVRELKRCMLILFLTRNLVMNLTGVRFFLGLFDKYNIDLDKLNELTREFGISEQTQQENIAKTRKRGRKPKYNKKAVL